MDNRLALPIHRAALLGCAIATLALAACSQPSAPTAAASAPASAASSASTSELADELQAYRQSLAQHQDMLAAPIGEEIVQKYPGSSAAAEVQKTLPQIQAAAKAKAEHTRLANLWYYQSANVDGLQHTASIYASPQTANSVRLVLRRHVKWGLSVYLFAPQGSKGFVCKAMCTVAMRVDGKREAWKAFLPKTGEPAMFINDARGFIATMQKAKVIDMDVVSRESGKETLKFEVGGYNPAQFTPLPGKR